MELCDGPLWDLSLTWWTSDPDFTPCFHQVVLSGAPLVLLILLLPLEIYFCYKSNSNSIPWSLRNILRVMGMISMVMLALIDIILTVTSTKKLFISSIISPTAEFVDLSLALIFGLLNIKRGIPSSGILFAFWTLRFVCQTLTFASVVRFGDEIGQVLNAALFDVKYCIGLGVYFLHMWADEPTIEEKFLHGDKPSPDMTSSFPNKLIFGWMTGFLRKGWKAPITMDDLHDLDPSVRCANVYSKWKKHWDKLSNQKYNKKPVHVLYPVFYTFGLSYLSQSFIQLLAVLFTQLNPQALNLLIGFISSGEEQWKGYLYMCFLVGVNMIILILNSQYFIRQLVIGLRMKSSLTSAIYRKTFKLTSGARRERSIGESVNLMQIDSQRLQDVIQNLNLLWSSPLTIVLSLYSLWGILGPSCMAGLTVMVLLIPTNALLGSRMKRFQRENMKLKDTRMKTMNEILDGMKVLKLYAWEPSFQEQVEGIRASEVDNLKRLYYLQCLQRFIFNATPFFVAIASFTTFVLIDSENILDAQTAFVSLSYFNIIKNPLISLPNLLIQMIQAQVSIDRLNNYLNAPECNPNAVTNREEGDTVIRVSNGTFSWEEGSTSVLKKINLEVRRKELVAIVGQVGSGKSSLLSSIINEMNKTVFNAEVNVNGNISYVPQQGWMQNTSLQSNITFGKDLDEGKYNKVIDACALAPDLEILPNGDLTEIGEKGINLSGGQKQRVSLARAVYNDGDIHLLDDPLSAVDAHVGKHIFDKVIGPTGLLKNKTRVLVTHGVKFLPYFDKIVVLKDGAISEVGTYKELLDQGREFADFLIQYIQEEEEKHLEGNDLEALELVKGDLANKIGKDKLDRQISKTSSVHSESNVSAISHFKVKRSTENENLNEKSLLKKRSNPNSNYGATANDMESKKKRKPEFRRGNGRKPGNGGRLMTTEHVETKAVDSAVYFFYFKAVNLKLAFLILILNIVQQALSIGTNVWLSQWADDPDAGETKARNIYLGIYGLLGTLTAVGICSVTLITAVGGLNASTKLHDNMLHSVLRAPMSFFDTNPKGRVVNRFAKDVDLVDGSIPNTFGALMRLGLGVLGVLFVICTTLPIFIAIIIPISFGYWMLQKFYVSTSRQLRRLESSTRSPVYSWFGESVSGVSTIKAYGMEESFCQQMESKVDTNGKTMMPNYIANRWLSIRLEILGNIIVFFASLLAVLGRDTLEPGMVGLSLSYAMQITGQLNMLIRQTSQIENNMVSVERIKEYQNSLPQEADWMLAGDPSREDWPQRGHIQLTNLEMRYREGLPLVLKGVNLSIQSGEKVGIVGRTGSGKSSLTLSLFRISESSGGNIVIDDLNIANIGLGTLRSSLTIIPQDPVLFSGSLRMNLDPFGKHNDRELWNSLELAHLRSFTSSLPGGLDFMISEGGGNLSVGQRQLLCLARACLRKTRILFLDEATAAVDLETDDLIQATIRTEFADSTILTIAHRINTIMDSDKVVVMDEGKVMECDSPQNLLMNENSVFYSMAKEAGVMSNKTA